MDCANQLWFCHERCGYGGVALACYTCHTYVLKQEVQSNIQCALDKRLCSRDIIAYPWEDSSSVYY
jgi:hypothetical protein